MTTAFGLDVAPGGVERLVALDPRDPADREADEREHECGEHDVAWAARPQEVDRPAAALEARRRAQVGSVELRRPQPLAELGALWQLGQVVSQLGDELAPHAPGQVAELESDAAEVVARGHDSTSPWNAALMRAHFSVPSRSCPVPLGVTT